MKEKLIAALKAAGLKEGLADVINITSEDQIEGVINQLRPTLETELDIPTILGSEEFKSYAEKVGFKKVIEHSKPLQSGHDKAVTDGIKSFQTKFLKKANDEEDDDDDDDDKMPGWAKALNDKIEKIESEKAKGSKLEQAKKQLKGSKLPDKLKEKWANRIQLDSDTTIEDQVKELEKEATELGLQPGAQAPGLPAGGPSDGKVSKEEAAKLVDDII